MPAIPDRAKSIDRILEAFARRIYILQSATKGARIAAISRKTAEIADKQQEIAEKSFCFKKTT